MGRRTWFQKVERRLRDASSVPGAFKAGPAGEVEAEEWIYVAIIGGRQRVRAWLRKRGRRVPGTKRWRMIPHDALWREEIDAVTQAAMAVFNSPGAQRALALDRGCTALLSSLRRG